MSIAGGAPQSPVVVFGACVPRGLLWWRGWGLAVSGGSATMHRGGGRARMVGGMILEVRGAASGLPASRLLSSLGSMSLFVTQ